MKSTMNQKPSSKREWKDMSRKEKKEVIAVIATIGFFILFWVSNGFLSAIAMILIGWSMYFMLKVIRSKGVRKKSIALAVVLFVAGGLILPSSQSTQPEMVAEVNNVESEKSKAEIAEQKRIATEERLKQELELAEAKKLELEKKDSQAQQPAPTGDLYQVVSITDGDTIKVSINGSTEVIRFIGMDTPETKDPRKPIQCFGKEASSRMQHHVQSKKVRLESDPSQGDRDKYNRLLRYVFAEDGRNIAYEMIKEGYAHEYTYNIPYKYQIQFKAAYSQARNASVGLWAAETCGGQTDQRHEDPKPQPAPSPAPAPVQSAPAPVAQDSVGSVYYKNCTAARAAGAAPVYAGQPGYGTHLDRDRDGIGCE